MLKKTKLFTHAVKSIDEEKRQATFVISTDEIDRTYEIVEQSWQLDNYKKNPIVLFGHDPSKPGYVVGCATEIRAEKDGDKNITIGTVQFAEEGTSSDADTVWKLVKQGILRTVSVGFIPHTFKASKDEDGSEITVLADNELLEFSIVPIPANPSAVALAMTDGSIEEKDAKFMLKTYKAEAQYIENSLCDTIGAKKTDATFSKGAKAMSDEDIAKIAEAVGVAVSEAIAPKLDEILDKVSDDNSDDKPADEPNEPEQMANEPIADDPEDDDDDDCKDGKEKSIAKSEQNDEDGAFDENEELDEEAEKQFVAELEKEYQILSE